MTNLFTELADKIKGKKLRLVFPEGDDSRVQGAAIRLKKMVY